MKRKIYLKILLGIVTVVLLIIFVTKVFVEPWIGKKIRAEMNEENRDYMVEIDKVHILIITSGIELESITICSKQEHGGVRDLNGEIAYIKFKGINLSKAIFKNDIYIRKVTISNSSIKGKIPFSGEAIPPIVLPLNIRIGKILFDKIDLTIENTSTAQSFSVKEGVLKVYDLQVEKQDTLSPGIVKKFDFEAEELVSVSSDSMYSFKASGIIYSATSNTLVVNSFSIKPNYTDYDFTSRYEFQTVRIEAIFSNIYVHNFYAAGYFISRSPISSYIEIGKMDMKVFRNKRKEFRHANMPAFQDMIYNYPGTIQIDSIGLIKGNVTYTVHDEKANEPGIISFNEMNAILEKNAFIYATSGKIDAMNFSFTANNSRATGKMTLLYHGLDIAVKNKQTDDTTAFRERFISFIANRQVLDSNPIPGEEVREGIIDYERDPERFLFSYCFKSILSGIKSSLAKNPKKRKNS